MSVKSMVCGAFCYPIADTIYDIPKFIFYALGYAIERVLSMSRHGIGAFLPTKIKSQQLNLFEHFKIEDCGAWSF